MTEFEQMNTLEKIENLASRAHEFIHGARRGNPACIATIDQHLGQIRGLLTKAKYEQRQLEEEIEDVYGYCS